jgi:hypothetical protein
VTAWTAGMGAGRAGTACTACTAGTGVGTAWTGGSGVGAACKTGTAGTAGRGVGRAGPGVIKLFTPVIYECFNMPRVPGRAFQSCSIFMTPKANPKV